MTKTTSSSPTSASRRTAAPGSAGPPPGRSRPLRQAIFALVTTVAVLALVEGLASLALVSAGLLAYRGTAESRHASYDADLGWSHRPAIRLPDFYGPGRNLTINGSGFRGLRDVNQRPTPGSRRLVCTGDSFTLGFGVDDEQTWCELLRQQHLETINMGQGGYGIDQAFLWYRRDGAPLDADVHVFAFIDLDFERMATDRFLGYPKPVLRVRKGRLEVEGIPVPRRRLGPWWSAASSSLRELRSVELLARFIPIPQATLRPAPAGGPVASEQVVVALFAELAALDRGHGTVPVLVFLPRLGDYAATGTDRWHRLVEREAARLSLPYIDLVPRLRQLESSEAQSLFILEDIVGLPGSAGHYNERGNRWVAEELQRELLAFPEVASGLSAPPSAETAD